MTRIPLILLAAAATACATGRPAGTQPGATAADTAPALVQPGAPGAATRDISVARATDVSRVQHTEADVKFMQGMIGHHLQAVEMVSLVPSRTAGENLRLLARRIDASQADEIKMMEEWLRAREQAVPDAHALHAHGATLMPGMLTAEEMAQLAAATGPEFERLFLVGMIKHHEGALIMVRDLFSQPGAGQESEIFAFASDVDADQRMEILRMGAMLKEIRK